VLRIRLQEPLGVAGDIPIDSSVITPKGLVGRVARIQGRYLDVQVITDPQARVHARAGPRGVLGSVIGRGPAPKHRLRFVTTEGKARLKAGDPVRSSGQDRRYTAGLVVGVIAEANARQSGVELEYLMDPVVPFWEIREVFLVRGTTHGNEALCYQKCVSACDDEIEGPKP
jgi:rod shape-determining protein MreC